MTTAELNAQRDSLKTQITAKMIEISADDVVVQDLLKQLSDVEDQLAAAPKTDASTLAAAATDQSIIDNTNRRTDASLGTSAR